MELTQPQRDRTLAVFHPHGPSSPTGAARPRIGFVQALRGASVLLVVWGHLGPAWLRATDQQWRPLTWWTNAVARPLHLFQDGAHLGVLIFFLISGFIITHASMRESRTQFAVKRVMRILPLLLLALILASALQQLALYAGLGALWGIGPWSLRSFIESLLLINWATGDHRMLGPTWTLEIEVIFYVLTFALLFRTRRDPLRATWLMTGLWSILCCVTFLAAPEETGAVHHPVYIGFLVLGRLIYLARERSQTYACVIQAGVVFLLIILLHTAAFPGELLASGAASLASQLGALLIFLAAMGARPMLWWRPLQHLGDWSYSLYLLHLPVGILVNEVGRRVGLPFVITLGCSFFVVVVLSWASYSLVERPLQQLARRMLSQHVSAIRPETAAAAQ